MLRYVTLFFLFAFGSAIAGEIDRLVVIGDSLSDTGNLSALTGGAVPPSPPSPPYAPGRFSDGPLWVDVVADRFGLVVNGVWGSGGTVSPLGDGSADNYAVAGSFTGQYTVALTTEVVSNVADLRSVLAGGSDLGIPGIPEQAFAYSAGGVDIGAQHIVWGGANDLLFSPFFDENLVGVTNFVLSAGANDTELVNFAESAADNVVALTQGLLAAGASNPLILNLPDLGRIPFAGFPPLSPDLVAALQLLGFTDVLLSAYLTTATEAFNNRLVQALTGMDVTLFDLAASFEDLIANPTFFGLTNVTDACLADLLSCDPDTYVFWDDVHPTSHVHAILGDQLSSTLPMPAPVPLMALGALLLAVLRSRA